MIYVDYSTGKIAIGEADNMLVIDCPVGSMPILYCPLIPMIYYYDNLYHVPYIMRVSYKHIAKYIICMIPLEINIVEKDLTN